MVANSLQRPTGMTDFPQRKHQRLVSTMASPKVAEIMALRWRDRLPLQRLRGAHVAKAPRIARGQDWSWQGARNEAEGIQVCLEKGS